jgi:hypothetical protein
MSAQETMARSGLHQSYLSVKAAGKARIIEGETIDRITLRQVG